MPTLFIGASSPIFAGVDGADGRRWASTVHAVAAGTPGPPFKTMCGLFVEYLNFGWEWPAELSERSCPGCVRMTLEPGFRATAPAPAAPRFRTEVPGWPPDRAAG